MKNLGNQNYRQGEVNETTSMFEPIRMRIYTQLPSPQFAQL